MSFLQLKAAISYQQRAECVHNIIFITLLGCSELIMAMQTAKKRLIENKKNLCIKYIYKTTYYKPE